MSTGRICPCHRKMSLRGKAELALAQNARQSSGKMTNHFPCFEKKAALFLIRYFSNCDACLYPMHSKNGLLDYSDREGESAML